MKTVIYWFRQDLRLHDQAVLKALLQSPDITLVPVFVLPNLAEKTRWGFTRIGAHRRYWLADALAGLTAGLKHLGFPLTVLDRPATVSLPALARRLGVTAIYCEDIAAPEERAEVQALQAQHLNVRTHWQSSMLSPLALPFPAQALPATFTAFRQAIEAHGCQPDAPVSAPSHVSAKALPDFSEAEPQQLLAHLAPNIGLDTRSAFPYRVAPFQGDEACGLRHLRQYLARGLAEDYKRTRDELSRTDASSKWSPWLATGAVSARTLIEQLKVHEKKHGSSHGSYWLWFELLWRDYFRFLHLQYEQALYRAHGLGKPGEPLPHDATAFSRWCTGHTGEALIDAGMRELEATGYLSNRMRQICASYLVHDMACDWRAGAAWFEAQLIDYDVYNNQGNWLYIAGLGTDPRGGRRFNPVKQAAQHDPLGSYRQRWTLA